MASYAASRHDYADDDSDDVQNISTKHGMHHHLAPEDRVDEQDSSDDEEEDDSSTNQSVVVSALSEETMAVMTQIFETLYQEHPLQVAKKASREERREREYISMSLVYGEIAFVPFKVVLDVLKRWHHVLKKPGGTFLDIGSGSGKAVFAAALLHDFDACYGIEVLEGLHAISQEVLQRWEKLIKPNFALSMQKKRTRISFTQGDALVVDWPANVDLVFLNSTCFGERLMHALSRKLTQCCKSGAIVITATHKLPDAQNFVELRQLTVTQEAWGDATWYLHRRK
ncbi:Histone-lysine N-methyltransferase [Phytophthora cinnamomi]|uniref:Histone-lysine N-methyltransferase n=1 Tax=Phytophthora cinnamomi TaxID=4785 RepID=UPI00355ACD63|nr:Histone-lysine N-methyltransferase [Phytophthora cinnamomi]